MLQEKNSSAIIDEIIEEISSGNSKECTSTNLKDHRLKKSHKRKRSSGKCVSKKRLCHKDRRWSESPVLEIINGKANDNGEIHDKSVYSSSIEKDNGNTSDIDIDTVIDKEINRQLRRSIPRPYYIEANDSDSTPPSKKTEKKRKGDKMKKKRNKHLKKSTEKNQRHSKAHENGGQNSPSDEKGKTEDVSPPVSNPLYKPPPSPVLVLSNKTEEILRNTPLVKSNRKPFIQVEKQEPKSELQNSESFPVENNPINGSDIIMGSRLSNDQSLQSKTLENGFCNSLKSSLNSNLSYEVHDVMDTPNTFDSSLVTQAMSPIIKSHKHKSKTILKIQSHLDLPSKNIKRENKCKSVLSKKIKQNNKGKRLEKIQSLTEKIEKCNDNLPEGNEEISHSHLKDSQMECSNKLDSELNKNEDIKMEETVAVTATRNLNSSNPGKNDSTVNKSKSIVNSHSKKKKKAKSKKIGSAAAKKNEENNGPSRILRKTLPESPNLCDDLNHDTLVQISQNHQENSHKDDSLTLNLPTKDREPNVFQCEPMEEPMKMGIEKPLVTSDPICTTSVEIEPNLKISSLKTVPEWDKISPGPPSLVALGDLDVLDVKHEMQSEPVVVLDDVLPILNQSQKRQLDLSAQTFQPEKLDLSVQASPSPQNNSNTCGAQVSNDISKDESSNEPVADNPPDDIPSVLSTAPSNGLDIYKEIEESAPPKRVFRSKPAADEEIAQPTTSKGTSLRSVKQKCYKHIVVKHLFNYTEVVIVVESVKKSSKNQIRLPKEYNYLNIQALKELVRAFLHCKNDDNCKAVLLSSVGPIFCSGVCPLALLHSHLEEDKSLDILFTLRKLIKILINFTKPLVAAVQGPAVDFGATLLLFCDSVFASDKANFHWSTAMQSVTPYGCVTALLPQVVGKIEACSLMMGCKTLTASEAKSLGLVTEVFPHDILSNSVIPRCIYLSTTIGHGLLSTKELLVNQKKKELLRTNEVEMNLLKECLKKESNRMIVENYIATNIVII